MRAGADQDQLFSAEVARIRASGAMGEGGRVLELFDFLAARGAGAQAATQAEIAGHVFGQNEAMADDATVRVYIHRLRKRLDDFYADNGPAAGSARLVLPTGSYALRLQADAAEDVPTPTEAPATRPVALRAIAAGVVVALAIGLLIGRLIPHDSEARPANALWQPLLESNRPTLIVLGDYYLYGEIDPVRPDEGRLIRDFQVNSPEDLERMQDMRPDRYARAEDFGLNYLPFSSAYGLEAVLPVLARDGRRVSVLAASELQPDMLNYFDVVYLGLFSGMKLLEQETFDNSALDIGDSYDELHDTASNRHFVSEEARRLTSPSYYRDYGYVARYRTLSGATIVVLAGARDTGLRGIAPLLTGPDLPAELSSAADDFAFEALYQVTGQQGADLSRRLILARERPAAPAPARP